VAHEAYAEHAVSPERAVPRGKPALVEYAAPLVRLVAMCQLQ